MKLTLLNVWGDRPEGRRPRQGRLYPITVTAAAVTPWLSYTILFLFLLRTPSTSPSPSIPSSDVARASAHDPPTPLGPFTPEQEAGADWPLTPDEERALEKFRPIANKIVYKDYMITDRYLIRFLQARELDVDAAAQMLQKSMNWRKEKKIDSILSEDFSIFDEHFKFIFAGHDKKGRPIAISLFGMYDIRKFAVSGRLQQMLRYFDRMQELAEVDLRRRRALPSGANITGTVSILDLAGFNLRQHACLQCLAVAPHIFRNLEENYPGFFDRIFLLNTPPIFYPVFDLIRPVLSKATKGALRIYGHNKAEWKSALLAEIEPDQLPMLYGGSRAYDSFHSDWRKQNPEVSALLKANYNL